MASHQRVGGATGLGLGPGGRAGHRCRACTGPRPPCQARAAASPTAQGRGRPWCWGGVAARLGASWHSPQACGLVGWPAGLAVAAGLVAGPATRYPRH